MKSSKKVTMNIPQNSKGFTLIEIVVVIAIAALILVAILIFVPQAQRSQRDGDRRSAAGKAVSKLNECASNHAGAVCNSAQFGGATGTGDLYTAGIAAPGGANYKFTFGASWGASGASCPAADLPSVSPPIMNVVSNGNGGQFAQVCIEAGGNTVYQSGS
jgi:prepilin-type N-terminal cleavage/methylation domain-containing protein